MILPIAISLIGGSIPEKDYEHISWYKGLKVNQRINIKELCPLIIGTTWDSLSFLFTMEEKIEIIYQKLKMEGFDV